MRLQPGVGHCHGAVVGVVIQVGRDVVVIARQVVGHIRWIRDDVEALHRRVDVGEIGQRIVAPHVGQRLHAEEADVRQAFLIGLPSLAGGEHMADDVVVAEEGRS